MPKSAKQGCHCGQEHVIAVFNRENYDPEFSIPREVVAVRDCVEAQEFFDTLHPNRDICEVASTRAKHFVEWTIRATQRRAKVNASVTEERPGQKCPSCGQYDSVWINHDPADDDRENSHLYCRNCDWGICPDC